MSSLPSDETAHPLWAVFVQAADFSPTNGLLRPALSRLCPFLGIQTLPHTCDLCRQLLRRLAAPWVVNKSLMIASRRNCLLLDTVAPVSARQASHESSVIICLAPSARETCSRPKRGCGFRLASASNPEAPTASQILQLAVERYSPSEFVHPCRRL